VIVREAQDIKVKDWEIFERYVENPVDTTILVFAHKNKALDKRTKIAKNIEKNSVYFESKKYPDDVLPSWISDYVAQLHFKISKDAAKVIAENLGNDLSRISNEIDKLSVMLADDAEITPEIIEKYIGISKEYNVTEFNRAIITRDYSKAMKMVLYFEKNPKAGPLIQILAFLYNHFSKLFVIQHYNDPRAASEAMGFKGGWLPDDLKTGGRYYSPQKTQDVIQLLCEYDAKAKGLYATNNSSNSDLLKELVYKVVR
jgi:DNA polymerase-3 subunit delta